MQPEFWDMLAEHVTAKVEAVLRQPQHRRASVIVYLRDLETLARRECQSREVLQIIASGRRFLGDLTEIEPRGGLFARD